MIYHVDFLILTADCNQEFLLVKCSVSQVIRVTKTLFTVHKFYACPMTPTKALFLMWLVK